MHMNSIMHKDPFSVVVTYTGSLRKVPGSTPGGFIVGFDNSGNEIT